MIADVIILLIAAVIAVPIFQATKLGAVPGFLIAGIIVGPSVLKLINNPEEIFTFAEIGVVLLLFIIGIELKPANLWRMRRIVFGLGALQVVLTGLVLTFLSCYFFNLSEEAGLLVGPALALSSTAFVLQLLKERRELMSNFGRTSFSILLFQDMAVVPLLALIPLLVAPDVSIGTNLLIALSESILILFLLIVGVRYLLHPLLHRIAISDSPETFTASAVLIVLGTALLTEHVGLSMAMGAFLAGLLISDSAYRHQIMAEVQPFAGLLLGLFFMSMGMKINLDLFIESPFFFIFITLGLVSIKIVTLLGCMKLLRYKIRLSLSTSLLLSQSGEFALVIFSLAFKEQLLNQTQFEHLLLIVLLSMLTTPFLAHMAHKISSHKTAKLTATGLKKVNAPILIVGFGRVGRRIGEILTYAGKPFIAIDNNAQVVSHNRSLGHPVYLGDASKHDAMKNIHIKNIEMIIITIDDLLEAERAITSLRKIFPRKRIVARGHDMAESRELIHLGANKSVSENAEVCIQLARAALKETGVNHRERDVILGQFRRSYYAKIEDILEEEK